MKWVIVRSFVIDTIIFRDMGDDSPHSPSRNRSPKESEIPTIVRNDVDNVTPSPSQTRSPKLDTGRSGSQGERNSEVPNSPAVENDLRKQSPKDSAKEMHNEASIRDDVDVPTNKTIVRNDPTDNETVVRDDVDIPESETIVRCDIETVVRNDTPPRPRSGPEVNASQNIPPSGERRRSSAYRCNYPPNDQSPTVVTDEVDGKLSLSRRSSKSAVEERKDSVPGSASNQRKTSSSVAHPLILSAPGTLMNSRKDSSESVRSQKGSPAKKPDETDNARRSSGDKRFPPTSQRSSHGSFIEQDLKSSIDVLDSENPYDGDSGRVLKEWTSMDNIDNFVATSKGIPKSKKQHVSSLINQLKSVTASEHSDSDEQLSRTSSPLVQAKDNIRAKSQPVDGKDSRASSHHPYNVIFESDEAASMDSELRRSQAARGFREKLGQSAPSNGPRFLGDMPSKIVSVRSVSELDANRLQSILDIWYSELRQALLAENAANRERVILEFNNSVNELMKSQQQDVDRLHSDIDSLHRLCRSYSKGIHQRDKTIANLADALASQKEQVVLARSFTAWRNERDEHRREQSLKLVATRHYRQKIVQRAWNAWRGMVQERWRQRIEKACQKRAEEVCVQMADRYDSRILELEALVKQLREENKAYRHELGLVNIKARNALLHGVSVLKTDLATFPNKTEGDSEPSSGKNISDPNSPSNGTALAQTETKTNTGNNSTKKRLKSVSSGPAPYAIEKHNSSRKNSAASSSSSGKSNRSVISENSRTKEG